MLLKTCEYTGSFARVADCPDFDQPEFAFIGRSNVGKSSLINMICDRKKLAYTSAKPGKTQTINLFCINREWFIADLPGYGYARVSKTQRKKWGQLIRDYVLKRSDLQCIFLLIDLRIPPQQSDLEFAAMLGEMRVPFVLVFTKTDRLKQHQIDANFEHFKKEFCVQWNELPQHFISSAQSGSGRMEILSFIENVNSKFVPLH